VAEFPKIKVPEDAPPLFLVAASNDNFDHHKSAIRFYLSWVDAGKSAEIHLYKDGGHGFGINCRIRPTSLGLIVFLNGQIICKRQM